MTNPAPASEPLDDEPIDYVSPPPKRTTTYVMMRPESHQSLLDTIDALQAQVRSLTTGIMADRAEIERVRGERDVARQTIESICQVVGHSINSSCPLELVVHKLTAERDALAARLATLPRTADGVPVTPGMKLYPLRPWPAEDLHGDEDYAVAQVTAVDPSSGYTVDAENVPNNYSTPEAARAALEARGG